MLAARVDEQVLWMKPEEYEIFRCNDISSDIMILTWLKAKRISYNISLDITSRVL